MSKIPTSFFSRGPKLFKAASKIALSELSSRLKTWESESEKLKSQIELAQGLVKTLSELKGASMKLGQLLSLDLGDYFPPQITAILEQLHQKSIYLPFSQIEQIIKNELGEKYFHLTDISLKPIAAASIGQVHRAKLNDKDVIIKVQYPGVVDSIPSDLKILEIILNQIKFLRIKSETNFSSFLEEIKDMLIKEADYKHEITMHAKYKNLFFNTPYIIPDFFTNYSTEKIITLEYIEGKSLTDWLSTGPDLKYREYFSDLLMKLYLEEIFIHRMVQTDPNPGNFLITPDHQLALIDFGAVKEYDEDFVEGYKKILRASYNRNEDRILVESFKLGFIDERESKEVTDIYLKMMDFLVDPFRKEEHFDFSDKDFFTTSRDLSWEMSLKCKYSPPPKDLLFLHRKLAGIFVFIKKLNVKIKLKDYWHYVEAI